MVVNREQVWKTASKSRLRPVLMELTEAELEICLYVEVQLPGFLFACTRSLFSTFLPSLRAKPSALASAASSACFLFSSSRTMMKRKTARQKRRTKRSRQLLQQRAANTETSDSLRTSAVRELWLDLIWDWLDFHSLTGVKNQLIITHRTSFKGIRGGFSKIFDSKHRKLFVRWTAVDWPLTVQWNNLEDFRHLGGHRKFEVFLRYIYIYFVFLGTSAVKQNTSVTYSEKNLFCQKMLTTNWGCLNKEHCT